MLRLLSIIVLRLAGWKTKPVGKFPYHFRKWIIIVAPHTSNWDFVIGVLYRKVLKLERARFLGKKELFKPPFGFVFRWLGGYPVDRTHNQNMVDEVVKIFNQHDDFGIALSPEGTRKKVDRLRTGFYNIARGAGVPVIMIALDYGNKQVVIAEPFIVSGNQEEDFKKIISFFGPVKGKNPELGLDSP